MAKNRIPQGKVGTKIDCEISRALRPARFGWAANAIPQSLLAAALVAALCLLGMGELSIAQTYPTRPIHVIHPYTPGSATDVALRLISQQVSSVIGQNIVVENRPGAGGTIGVTVVKNAKPDGYTLGQVDQGTQAVNPALMPHLAYNPLSDFQPITRLFVAPEVLLVPKSSPANSVAELVALAESKPGGLAYGSQGVGSGGHLLGAMASKVFGAHMIHVPYSGAAAGRTDLVTGRVDLTFAIYGAYRAEIEAKTVKVLAVASPERSALLPDVPTMAESGYPQVEMTLWFGLVGPVGMDPSIVKQLNGWFVAAAKDPKVVATLARQGLTASPGTPEELQEQTKHDMKTLGEMVRTAGVTVQ